MNDNEDTRFAAAMKREREKRGWNQSQLADELQKIGLSHFHQNTVSRIEKNDRVVRMSEAAVIARLFERSVEEMTRRRSEPLDRMVERAEQLGNAGLGLQGILENYLATREKLKWAIAAFEFWRENEGTAISEVDKSVIDVMYEWATEEYSVTAVDVAKAMEEEYEKRIADLGPTDALNHAMSMGDD